MYAPAMSDTAQGWEAITAALTAVYGEQEPSHWGTIVKFCLGGPDPLDGVSAYDAGDHYHYVSYGLSELYEKESELEDQSGWGFELTFRLKKRPGDETPPIWPINFLQNLARYVIETSNILAAGDHMPANGPIASDEDTAIDSMLFTLDPELPVIDTPNGKLAFHQIVGITSDELRAAQSWNTDRFLDLMRQRSAKLVTDLDRSTYRNDPKFEAKLEAGRKEEGSSTDLTFVDNLQCSEEGEGLLISLGALWIESMLEVLPFRLPFGRDYYLIGEDVEIRFSTGNPGFSRGEEGYQVTLSADGARQLRDSVKPLAGRYPLPELPGVAFLVKKTQIKDSKGKITRIVG